MSLRCGYLLALLIGPNHTVAGEWKQGVVPPLDFGRIGHVGGVHPGTGTVFVVGGYDGTYNLDVLPTTPLPTVVSLMGNSNFKAEKMVAYELGYRTIPTEKLSLDFTVFQHYYENLIDLSDNGPFVVTTPSSTYANFLQVINNSDSDRTYGAEIFAQYNYIHV